MNLATPIVIVKNCDVMRYALSPKCVLGSIKGKLIKYMHVKIETKREQFFNREAFGAKNWVLRRQLFYKRGMLLPASKSW